MRTRHLASALLLVLGVSDAAWAQRPLALRLRDAIVAAGVPIDNVSIVDTAKSTWKVSPANLQAAAQPVIDAFDPNDPAYARADADAEVDADAVVADVLAAMLRHWPAIQAEITAGTYKEAQWRPRILATARQLRRARKGV